MNDFFAILQHIQLNAMTILKNISRESSSVSVLVMKTSLLYMFVISCILFPSKALSQQFEKMIHGGESSNNWTSKMVLTYDSCFVVCGYCDTTGATTADTVGRLYQ
jgi:hypothetical protein